MAMQIRDLPSAVERRGEIAAATAGRRVAVFLDYDGTLSPIAERPEDAVLLAASREVVRRLALRCPVAVISGRDRADVERLVGLDELVYAGSHGFDIGSPKGAVATRQEGGQHLPLVQGVIARLHRELDGIPGSQVEPKAFSVAVHYRRVAPAERTRVAAVVEAILADHAELRATPGKMIYEIQPRIDWDKGKAVLHLLEALGLDAGDVLPMFFGDDITDEDGFRAVRGIGGLGFVVEDGAAAERSTAADYRLRDPDEVARFLDGLGR